MKALHREKGIWEIWGLTPILEAIWGLTPIVWTVCALVGCRTIVPSPTSEDCRPFAQVAPEGTPLGLPVIAAGAQHGNAVVVGYVADSTSGRGVGRAVVLLVSFEKKDSIAAYADSTGRFTIDGVRPGRYRYTVRSVNFRQRRDSLDVQPGIDTLRVVLTRGLPLCSVKLD